MNNYITFLSKVIKDKIVLENSQVNMRVFDECTINLCRSLRNFNKLFPNIDFKKEKVRDIQLEVLDVDFNISNKNGSKMGLSKENPDYITITLKDIDIKFLGKVVDCNFKCIGEECFNLKYLPSSGEEGFHQVTNPKSINIELYNPNQSSEKCISQYNFGKKVQDYVVDTEAFGKVINIDMDKYTADIMLKINFKLVDFKNYKKYSDVKRQQGEEEFK